MDKIKNEELNNFSFLLGKNKGEVSKRRSKNKMKNKERKIREVNAKMF